MLIRYKQVAIGTQWCTNEVVGDKMIALAYGKPGSNLAYPKETKIWSQITSAWTTIDIRWLSSVIGWVEGEESVGIWQKLSHQVVPQRTKQGNN